MSEQQPRLMPQYPIYIPSRGRYENCLTAQFLDRDGVPFFLVVEPQEADEYTRRYGESRVLVLPFRDLGSVIPARNWIKEHATASGAERHWQLDDNIKGTRRWFRGKRIACASNVAFRVVEDLADRYENVAIAGPNYTMFAHQGGKQPKDPFWLNVHVYSASLILNSLPYEWRGRYNEDTDLCLQVLAGGWCTISVNAFMVDKVKTMTLKGGNTDALNYHNDGRLKMARSLERQWPGVVTVNRRFQRPQHIVKNAWKGFDTPLKLKETVKLEELPENDYGLQLTALAEVKSERLKERFGDVMVTRTALASAALFDAAKLERDEETGLWYRPDTVDKNIIHGDAKSYTKKCPLRPGDRVLDIGAHIGASSYWFYKSGAQFVIGVEPDPENFVLFEHNVMPDCSAVHAAATGGYNPTITLWKNAKPRGTVFHSTTEHRGRIPVTVPAINFTRLIEANKITYVKMDCEGAEYDLLANNLSNSVRALVLEFHAEHRSWLPLIEPTIAKLRAQGFVPDKEPPTRPTETAWVWTIAWTRETA